MWARNEMVKEGLLSSKSAYGVWEITNEGRKWLTEQENGKQKDDKNRDPYIPF
jgi:predicted transcriptional regulator